MLNKMFQRDTVMWAITIVARNLYIEMRLRRVKGNEKKPCCFMHIEMKIFLIDNYITRTHPHPQRVLGTIC